MYYVRSHLPPLYAGESKKAMEMTPIETAGTTLYFGKNISAAPWENTLVVPVEKNRNMTFSVVAKESTTASITLFAKHRESEIWTPVGDLSLAADTTNKLTLTENWDEFRVVVNSTNKTIASISMKSS